MDTITLLLRLIHILGGVFWVGSALAMNFYIGPAVGATADSGRAFIGHLIAKTSFSRIILVAAYSTVIAGAILFWRDSDGFTSGWLKSGAGIGFSIGAAFALIGLVCGILVGQNSTRLGQLGAQIQGKPTPEQLQKLQAIQKQQAIVGPMNEYSLILAVIFMAMARYLVF
jgi:uncharacterized membrane protein